MLLSMSQNCCCNIQAWNLSHSYAVMHSYEQGILDIESAFRRSPTFGVDDLLSCCLSALHCPSFPSASLGWCLAISILFLYSKKKELCLSLSSMASPPARFFGGLGGGVMSTSTVNNDTHVCSDNSDLVLIEDGRIPS